MGIRTSLTVAICTILLPQGGCDSAPAGPPLSEGRWELVSLQGKPVIPAPKPLTAEFLPSGTLSCHGGVNAFEVNYKIHGKRITIGEEWSTTLVGSLDRSLAEQEAAFQRAVGQIRSYSVSNEVQLHLYGPDGRKLAILKKVPR